MTISFAAPQAYAASLPAVAVSVPLLDAAEFQPGERFPVGDVVPVAAGGRFPVVFSVLAVGAPAPVVFSVLPAGGVFARPGVFAPPADAVDSPAVGAFVLGVFSVLPAGGVFARPDASGRLVDAAEYLPGREFVEAVFVLPAAACGFPSAFFALRSAAVSLPPVFVAHEHVAGQGAAATGLPVWQQRVLDLIVVAVASAVEDRLPGKLPR